VKQARRQPLACDIPQTVGIIAATATQCVLQGTSFVAQQSGLYGFCFDNKMSRWTAKVATFDLDVTTGEEAKADAAAISSGRFKPVSGDDADPSVAVSFMRAATHRVHSKLTMITSAQSYHYHRERRHRDTLESTNSRVQMWAMVETLAAIAIAGGQLMLVRSWFKRPALPGAV
jgi:hypothetical protein